MVKERGVGHFTVGNKWLIFSSWWNNKAPAGIVLLYSKRNVKLYAAALSPDRASILVLTGCVYSLGQGVTTVQKVELEQLSTDRRISGAGLKHYRQSVKVSSGNPQNLLWNGQLLVQERINERLHLLISRWCLRSGIKSVQTQKKTWFSPVKDKIHPTASFLLTLFICLT